MNVARDTAQTGHTPLMLVTEAPLSSKFGLMFKQEHRGDRGGTALATMLLLCRRSGLRNDGRAAERRVCVAICNRWGGLMDRRVLVDGRAGKTRRSVGPGRECVSHGSPSQRLAKKQGAGGGGESVTTSRPRSYALWFGAAVDWPFGLDVHHVMILRGRGTADVAIKTLSLSQSSQAFQQGCTYLGLGVPKPAQERSLLHRPRLAAKVASRMSARTVRKG